jgi:hypothetical protein
MSKDTIEKLIDGVRTLVLVGLGILALHLGHGEVGTGVIMGALGLAAPAARRRTVAQ